MRNPIPRFGIQKPEICLQRNDVPERCGCVCLQSRGAVFHFPRWLDLMSSVIISVEWRCPGCGWRTVRIEAIVIGCRETCGGMYETTVIFIPGDGSCASAEFRHLPN